MGLRIVGGEWARRRLASAPGSRPTTERTREALFAIWQARLAGSRFLDVFCGGGAVGLEALSRGAQRAVLADRDPDALAVARANASRLGARSCRTVRAALPGGLTGARWRAASFDLIFADPPYGFGEWAALLENLAPLLAPAGEIVLEHGDVPEPPARTCRLRRTDQRKYGSTRLSFYAGRDPEPAGDLPSRRRGRPQEPIGPSD